MFGMRKNRLFTIVLYPEQLYVRLKKLSELFEITMSEVVRQLIAKEYRKHFYQDGTKKQGRHLPESGSRTAP